VKLDERRRLHGLDVPALQTELNDTQDQLLRLRFDAGLKRLTNTASLHTTRKRVAVIKTIIREKQLVAEHDFSTMAEYRAFRQAECATFKARRKARRRAANTGR
jgi:ribosomal protein L29